jgi:hypothetical protein
MEYGGMGGVMGLRYDAVKDFIKWAIPDGYSKDEVMKQYIPLVLSLGNYYASCLNQKQ